MNTNIIERRQNFAFYFLMEGLSSYPVDNVQINFIPDEMILRSVVYFSNEDEGALDPTLIYCDFVENSSQSICSIYDAVSYCPNSYFTLKKPIQGVINFTFRDYINQSDDTRTGVLILHCEFVKYKDQKQEKIY